MKINNLQLPERARWTRRIPFLVMTYLCLLYPSVSFAQTEESDTPTHSRWSINIALGNHSVGFPFQNLAANLNPAISDLGIEYRLNKSQRHVFSIASQSTFVHNPVIGHSILNGFSLNYTYVHRLGFAAGMDLGLGHLLQVYPRETFAFDAPKDMYQPAATKTFGSSFSGLGITMGYDFAPKFKLGYFIFLRNKFYIQSPYFNTAGFPILPQNIFELGIKIDLNTIIR